MVRLYNLLATRHIDNNGVSKFWILTPRFYELGLYLWIALFCKRGSPGWDQKGRSSLGADSVAPGNGEP